MNVFARFGDDVSCVTVSDPDNCVGEIESYISEKYDLEEGLFWISGHGVSFDVNLRLFGGKGGFGRAMKQEGERLSKRLPHHKDSCRTITGKRIGSLKARKKIRELRAKIKELEEERAARKKQMQSSQAAKEMELLEKEEHELSTSMEEAVAKGLEISKSKTENRQTCIDDSDFALLYGE